MSAAKARPYQKIYIYISIHQWHIQSETAQFHRINTNAEK